MIERKIYNQQDPVALAQERVVNKAFQVYEEKAAAVTRLWEENGEDEPRRGEPSFKEFNLAKAAKRKAFTEWQRAAHAHGAMFVEMHRG